MYTVNTKAVYQKSHRIPDGLAIIDYIKDTDFDKGLLTDDVVLMVGIDGALFELNLIGGIIFEETAEGKSLCQITRDLAAIFDVPDEVIENDAGLYILKMLDMKLLAE